MPLEPAPVLKYAKRIPRFTSSVVFFRVKKFFMPDSTQQPEGEPLIRAIAMPADANPSGDIFGGWLMSQMDLAAANAASRRCRGRCATVAVDGGFHVAGIVALA